MKISPGCVEILLSLVWWFATQQTTNTLHSSSPFKEKNIRIPQKKISWSCTCFGRCDFVLNFLATFLLNFLLLTTLNVKTLMLEYAYPKREREKFLRSKKNQIVYGERNYCNCVYFRSILLLCLLKSCVCLGEHEIWIEKKYHIFSRFSDPFFGWIWRHVILISGIRSVTILKYSNYLVIFIFFLIIL